MTVPKFVDQCADNREHNANHSVLVTVPELEKEVRLKELLKKQQIVADRLASKPFQRCSQ